VRAKLDLKFKTTDKADEDEEEEGENSRAKQIGKLL
jgi:hypothetical protein